MDKFYVSWPDQATPIEEGTLWPSPLRMSLRFSRQKLQTGALLNPTDPSQNPYWNSQAAAGPDELVGLLREGWDRDPRCRAQPEQSVTRIQSMPRSTASQSAGTRPMTKSGACLPLLTWLMAALLCKGHVSGMFPATMAEFFLK